ncbi:Cytochrome P450 78A9 [Rhynchospora pubera]|uniref:Cytochrome P450 78A9 n=1 Tax=Rhynchospora pubera TaxID=906938 RepID=A0AAV8EAJ9_9POAL|nr:Cytochrome P450 78A9 [Rhynchospora pubera]
MAPVAAENGWLLFLSIAAKCGEFLTQNPSLYLFTAFLLLLMYLTTTLHHWATPGGPAWGRYWWGKNWSKRSHDHAMIPGPSGFPVIGSMTLMIGLAHRKLAAVAESLGTKRLMAFSIGDSRAVVTSDPDVAREILAGSAFVDRPAKESAYALMFHRAIGFAPYGLYWRTLRRISAAHLFSPEQIMASASVRADIAFQMIDAMHSSASRTDRPDVRRVIKLASLNNIMGSVFGMRYELKSESEEAKELIYMVEEGYDLLGTLNWSDHLSMLTGLDFQKIRSRCNRLLPRVNRFVNRIVEEHRARHVTENSKSFCDFVDVLLSLQNSENLSDSDIASVLWELIFRGTDTVAVVIEWILARLVMHQDVQAKVHEELDRMVGPHQSVTESDSSSLHYLQAVIKEVLRLHPPGPLLSWARLAISDTYIGGLLVPAGTTAMVNMWAITHDPSVWPEPLKFKPERFMEAGSADFPIFGADLRLAPFGSGRRSCPGKTLAMKTVTFWVASLLHEFYWLPASDGTPVDLSEVLRLSCEMAAPLAVTLCPRRSVH